VLQFVNSLTDPDMFSGPMWLGFTCRRQSIQSDCSSNLSFIYLNICCSKTIDDSYNDDLILSNKREIDASNSISAFRDDLFTNSPLRAVFSGDVAIEEVNATHGSFSVKTASSISIYFQNINRLRFKTSDLFGAVILNDFDAIVLLETSLVNSFHDKEFFDDRYFVFRCDRSAASSSKKSGGGVLVAVKRDFDVDVVFTSHGLCMSACGSSVANIFITYLPFIWLRMWGSRRTTSLKKTWKQLLVVLE
jgi:hypothetical protein